MKKARLFILGLYLLIYGGLSMGYADGVAHRTSVASMTPVVTVPSIFGTYQAESGFSIRLAPHWVRSDDSSWGAYFKKVDKSDSVDARMNILSGFDPDGTLSAGWNIAPVNQQYINLPLAAPIVVPDIALEPPVTIPNDPGNNFAGFSFQVAKNWERAVVEDDTTWTMFTGKKLSFNKDSVHFVKRDPQSHAEIGRLCIVTETNPNDSTLEGLKSIYSGSFAVPVQWGEYSGGVHTEKTANGSITIHNHGSMSAFLCTPTLSVQIDADYPKLVLTKEDMDEFIAMAHSFKALPQR